MNCGCGVPDLEAAKRQVPITAVAEQLGLKIYGRMIRCWRPENHQHGDRTPSVGIDLRRNRVRCFVCDARLLSTIDLVQSALGLDTYEALLWLAARFDIPSIAKGKHLVSRSKNSHGRVGVSANPLEAIVRSGLWGEMSDVEVRVLEVIVIFLDPDTGLATLSYRALRRFSGVRKDSSISRALRRLANLHVIEVIRGRGGHGLSACNRYRLTVEDTRFVALLNDHYRTTREEIEAERRLRAERRSVLFSQRKTSIPKPGRADITGIDCLPRGEGETVFPLPSGGSGK
jgi:hypothetical protein